MAQIKAQQAKEMAQEKFGKMKVWFGEKKQKFDNRLTMQGILKQARESFEYFLQSGIVPIEKRISDKLMRDAYGIVFLTEVKVGVLAGGKLGTGIIITRVEDKEDEWSAPIAVGTGGLSFGFQAGVSKVDHIIILPSPNHVKAFIGKGQLQIKGNAEAAIANYGRDANVGVGVSNKGDAAPIMSYSFGVKGLYGGVSVDGAVLIPRKACNEAFYGQQVDLKDISNGKVEAPALNEDYKRIIELLNNHSAVGNHSAAGNVMNNEDLKENVGYQPVAANPWKEGNLENTPGDSQYDQFNSTF